MSFFFPKASTTVRESTFPYPYVNDPIDPQDVGYRALGAANRDLYGWTLRRAQEMSLHLYRSNPIASRLIRIYRSYCSGEGFAVVGHHPEVQQVLDEAWSSPRSDLDENHPGFTRDWLIFGEAPLPVAADDAGNVTVGWIDPTTIEQVSRDPRNNLILTTLYVRRGLGVDMEPLDIVTTQTDPLDPSAGLLVGDVFFWPYDRISGATRGTPFLLPIIDWLDLYDQNLWEMAERVKAMRAHMWDVKVMGDQLAVDALEKKWGTSAPKTGSTRFHNEKVTVEAVAPQLGQYEDVNGARFLLRHISTGGGVAPHWLSEPEDANRATAESMDDPVLKNLIDVQAAWKRNITRLCQFIVDRKVEAGLLDRFLPRFDSSNKEPIAEANPEPTRNLVEVVVPEIDEESVGDAAQTLLQIAQAFTALDAIGAVGREAMRKIVRQVLPALGVPEDELPDEDPDDQAAADQALDDFVEAASRYGF